MRHRSWRSYRCNFHFLLGYSEIRRGQARYSYTENYTENNFTANIDHYHVGDDGSDNDWRKSATPIHGAVSENVPKDYLSKDTREDSR